MTNAILQMHRAIFPQTDVNAQLKCLVEFNVDGMAEDATVLEILNDVVDYAEIRSVMDKSDLSKCIKSNVHMAGILIIRGRMGQVELLVG